MIAACQESSVDNRFKLTMQIMSISECRLVGCGPSHGATFFGGERRKAPYCICILWTLKCYLFFDHKIWHKAVGVHASSCHCHLCFWLGPKHKDCWLLVQLRMLSCYFWSKVHVVLECLWLNILRFWLLQLLKVHDFITWKINFVKHILRKSNSC